MAESGEDYLLSLEKSSDPRDQETARRLREAGQVGIKPKPGEAVRSGEVGPKDATPASVARTPRRVPPY